MTLPARSLALQALRFASSSTRGFPFALRPADRVSSHPHTGGTNMKKPMTCKFCTSTDVSEDLEYLRMCELCCRQEIDILFAGLGPVRSRLLKRHIRRWRFLTDVS